MKNFIYIILFSVFISSCCGFASMGCQEINGVYYIYYNDFLKEELDSVYLLKYRKNTNFTELLDSIQIKVDSNRNGNIGLSSYLGLGIDTNNAIIANNDYKIFIKDIDKTITITEIKEEQQSCKKCGSVKKIEFVGISSLKQDNIVLTVPPNSGFINGISISK